MQNGLARTREEKKRRKAESQNVQLTKGYVDLSKIWA
jgi:hypothetical protein